MTVATLLFGRAQKSSRYFSRGSWIVVGALTVACILPSLSVTAAVVPEVQSSLPGLAVQVDVQGEAAGLRVKLMPQAGTHINLEAPATLSALGARYPLETTSSSFLLPKAPPADALLEASLFLCDDAKTWCKPLKLAFRTGMVQGAGSATASSPASSSMAVAAASPSATSAEAHANVQAGLHYAHAIQEDADAAFQKASAENKLVLIDFYGIWCPPCQLLVSQGFNDPRATPLLEKMVVLQMDADRAASWPLKSRYQVTGYPTVVVTNSAGEEVGRMLGFGDGDSFVQWLSRTTAAGKPLKEWVAKRNSGDRSPETLLGLARAEEAIGLEEEAAALYEEALPKLTGQDALDARMSVLAAAAGRGDVAKVENHARVLAAESPMHLSVPGSLLGAASALKKKSGNEQAVAAAPRLADLAISTAAKVVAEPGRTPYQRASAYEIMGYAADLKGDSVAAKKAWSQSADLLITLEKGLKGEGSARLDSFRGQAHSLLDMLESSERFAEADVYFKKLTAAYPQEFSYHFTYAAFLQSQKRLPDAAREARLALTHSYGDNRLRATLRLAKILAAQGDKAGARTILEETIRTTVLPSDPTVRTHRYVAQLQQTLKDL